MEQRVNHNHRDPHTQENAETGQKNSFPVHVGRVKPCRRIDRLRFRVLLSEPFFRGSGGGDYSGYRQECASTGEWLTRFHVPAPFRTRGRLRLPGAGVAAPAGTPKTTGPPNRGEWLHSSTGCGTPAYNGRVLRSKSDPNTALLK